MANAEMIKIADEFFALKNFSQAEKIYVKILEESPNDVHILINLGLIYFEQHKFHLAEKFLELALSLGHDLQTLKILAHVKQILCKYYDSIVMYEQVIELEPQEFFYDQIQKLYENIELFDKEIEFAKKRVELFHSEASYMKLFTTYIKTGR